MSGHLWSGSGPDDSTTVRARNRLRANVVSVHTPSSSSKSSPLTSTPNWIRLRRSNASTMPSMCSKISPAGEYARDQFGFFTNENEYSSDGTSHAAPGYVLSRQVPPTRSSRSRITKSSTPAWVSLIAVPIPVKPAPTISVSYTLVSATSRRRLVGYLVDPPRHRRQQRPGVPVGEPDHRIGQQVVRVPGVGDHAGVAPQEPVCRHPAGGLAAVAELFEALHRFVQPLRLHTHGDDLIADPVDQRRTHDRADDQARSGVVADEVDQQPSDLGVPDHVEHFEIDDEVPRLVVVDLLEHLVAHGVVHLVEQELQQRAVQRDLQHRDHRAAQ